MEPTQLTTTNINPQPPISKKSFPFLPILLSLLLVLSLASTAYLAYQNMQLQKEVSMMKQAPSPTPTPTVDPTSDWKTYTSSTYNVSFKYPVFFRVNESDRNDVGFGKGIFVDYNQTDGQPERWLSISTVDKTDVQQLLNLSVGQTYKDIAIKDFPVSITRLPNQQIGNNDTMIFEADKGWEMPYGPLRTYLIYKNNTYYRIFVTYTNTTTEPNKNFVQTVDQILSTFRFLPQSISGWKTYTDPHENFTYQYPGNLFFIESNTPKQDFYSSLDLAQKDIRCFVNKLGTLEQPCGQDIVISISVDGPSKIRPQLQSSSPYNDSAGNSWTVDGPLEADASLRLLATPKEDESGVFYSVGIISPISGLSKYSGVAYSNNQLSEYFTNLTKQILSTATFVK